MEIKMQNIQTKTAEAVTTDEYVTIIAYSFSALMERFRESGLAAQGYSIAGPVGLLIAGSQCPYTHFFKPMARFHLPFANKDETLWRAAATYLMARYFTDQGLKEEDMDLDGLVKIYNDVAQLNVARIPHQVVERDLVADA